MSYATGSVAAKHYGVHGDTIRDWANAGKIKYIRTPGGHRRYLLTDPKDFRKNYIYARVSSRKQAGELEHQVQLLRSKYPSYEIIKDIGSGLNYKRPGFKKILEQLFIGDIGEVVVTSSDRFSRFGARDLFQWIFMRFGAQLTILSKAKENSGEELTEDLFEVLTVFASRYHGSRRYSNKKNQNLSDQGAEDSLSEML